MSTGQMTSGCCCGCFYRIPLCGCENDQCCVGGSLPPPGDFYIGCELADAFFDANPGLGDHLVFGFFDPCGDGECCYELTRNSETVPSVPADGIELTEPPPPPTWYLPPFDNCQFCCPSPCCIACCLEPGINPACCFRPGVDTLTVTISGDFFDINSDCCMGGESVKSCFAFNYVRTYEMVTCHLWLPTGGATCPFSFVGLDCAPPGWFTSEDHTCTWLCEEVGPKCADLMPCFGQCALDCVPEIVDLPDLCDGFGFDVVCEVLDFYVCGGMPECICQFMTLKVRVAAQGQSCFNFPAGCCDQPCTCTADPI